MLTSECENQLFMSAILNLCFGCCSWMWWRTASAALHHFYVAVLPSESLHLCLFLEKEVKFIWRLCTGLSHIYIAVWPACAAFQESRQSQILLKGFRVFHICSVSITTQTPENNVSLTECLDPNVSYNSTCYFYLLWSAIFISSFCKYHIAELNEAQTETVMCAPQTVTKVIHVYPFLFFCIRFSHF